MKDFYCVDNKVGFGDADDCFGVSLESINERLLECLRGCCIYGKSGIACGVINSTPVSSQPIGQGTVS